MAGARPELAIVDERVRLDDTELAAMIRQDTPESVDYRNSACMNPVRNQVREKLFKNGDALRGLSLMIFISFALFCVCSSSFWDHRIQN